MTSSDRDDPRTHLSGVHRLYPSPNAVAVPDSYVAPYRRPEGGPQPAEIHGVSVALKVQAEALERLYGAVGELSGRLDEVLKPDLPSCGNAKACGEKMGSPVANHLDSHTAKIGDITSTIQRLIARLDV
jgi:hypothetical protein